LRAISRRGLIAGERREPPLLRRVQRFDLVAPVLERGVVADGERIDLADRGLARLHVGRGTRADVDALPGERRARGTDLCRVARRCRCSASCPRWSRVLCLDPAIFAFCVGDRLLVLPLRARGRRLALRPWNPETV
jgi:hypothetical protein